ncbi:MAG: hypothetical protein JNL32_14080, partial [Candidatus Kapabacteria bacterium]|nr:hypothetical protein [Candidatus Kapabacteria bacterium]
MHSFLQFICCVSALLSPLNLVASGMDGTYPMTGTANYRGKPLINVTIMFRVGAKEITVQTTAKGAYWVRIPWEIPCTEGSRIDTSYVTPRYYTVMWN